MDDRVLYPVDILNSDEDWNINNLEQLALAKEQLLLCDICNLQISSKAVMQIHKKHLYDHGVNEISSEVFVLICPVCNKTVAVWSNNKWWIIKDILKSGKKEKNGFLKIRTPGEELVLWCLNEVVFNEYENNNPLLNFLPIPRKEFSKIFWLNNEAAGFYTLKRKGMLYSLGQFDQYCLPVVDLIFVRLKFRGRGIGQKIVEDVVSMFPQQDIGFSYPVTEPMLRVLQKVLIKNPHLRSLLWETKWIGCEGYRKNLWFAIAKQLQRVLMNSSQRINIL